MSPFKCLIMYMETVPSIDEGAVPQQLKMEWLWELPDNVTVTEDQIAYHFTRAKPEAAVPIFITYN